MFAIGYRMTDRTLYVRRRDGTWVHSVRCGEAKTYPSAEDDELIHDLIMVKAALSDLRGTVETLTV